MNLAGASKNWNVERFCYQFDKQTKGDCVKTHHRVHRNDCRLLIINKKTLWYSVLLPGERSFDTPSWYRIDYTSFSFKVCILTCPIDCILPGISYICILRKKRMNMKESNKRVLVGMSGGIDSTATCLMLQEQGYEIVGVTMRVWGIMWPTNVFLLKILLSKTL